jgi:hypothetical protein
MSDNYFKKGSYNVSCAICASTRKREMVRKNRNGLLCCIDRDCHEMKHPLEKPQPIIGADDKPVSQAQLYKFEILEVDFGTTLWEEDGLDWGDTTWYWDDSTNIYGNEID